MGFLTFLLMLALVSAGVVWYVGPTLAGIVVDAERRENAYFLLQLLPAAATTSDERSPSYRSRFVSLAQEESGRLLWEGGTVEVAEGSVLLDVGAAQLLEFASGVDLVQLLTSSAYRSLRSGFGGLAAQHVGSAAAPQALAGDAATVVVLYEADPAARAPLGTPGDGGWLGLLPRYRGEVRWQAEASVLRGSEPWNRIMMLQFPSVAAARGWLEDPVTVTERAIAARQVDALTALVAHPAAYAAPR